MTRSAAWITGSNGLIGHQLLQSAPACAPAWRVLGLTRQQLELTDHAAVRRAFSEQSPSLIIHCAAVSRSTDCQADPALARKINIDVTARLVELAADIPFVFFSSDLVFDGRTGNYDEAAPVNPLSIYAETKVTAEKIVLANPRHTVVRTSLNGGTSLSGDRGFNEELRLAWQQGKIPRLFIDEFRCPIPASETARAVWDLITRCEAVAGRPRIESANHNAPLFSPSPRDEGVGRGPGRGAALSQNFRAGTPGLFHIAGAERLSRLQIGQLIAARWPKLNPRIEPGSLKDYQGAPRSPDTSLNCAKAQKLLTHPLPRLTDWLAAHPNVEF